MMMKSGVFDLQTGKMNGSVRWPVLVVLGMAFLSLLPACVSNKRYYAPQIDLLAQELNLTFPTTVEEVIHFAALRSHQVNLGIAKLQEDLTISLLEEGSWHRKVLLAYLLALSESSEGFEAFIELLDEEEVPPRLREGLIFCGMKYLGYTESDTPAPVAGWDVDLSEWKEALESIRDLGLHAWRLDSFRKIVLSGKPGSGDEALLAASWLAYKLKVGDVPFLAGLLEQGSPKCDIAILEIVEKLLLLDFRSSAEDPEQESGLEAGIAALRAWEEENAAKPPDLWITQAYIDRGYKIEDLYNQNSISKIVTGLFDNSEQWISMRSHTLAALNRISGLKVDRSLIFESEAVRQEVVESYLAWYRELAAQVKTE